MAKKKGGTASDAVRGYLAEKPDASPTDIVDGLAQRGVTVSLALARKVKYGEGKTGGAAVTASVSTKARRKTGKKKGRKKKAVVRAAATKDDRFLLSHLVEARKVAEQFGGVESAKRALDALAKLQ